MVKINQRAKFQVISSMRSPGNARKPQIWHVSLRQNSAKITKINRLWPKTNQFWRWSRYISMQNFRLFPPCILQEMPGNPKFDPFHWVKIAPKLQQGKSEGFDSCDRPSNLKLDSNHQFFRPCDCEIWWMTSKNNRALLLYYVKLCASFQIH